MNNERNYLTEVRKDWATDNLLGLRDLLRAANDYAHGITDHRKHPAFGTPNRAIMTGVIRWGVTDYYLAQGAMAGRLKGITAHWRMLTKPAKKKSKANGPGGIHALELRGNYTCLIAFHLHKSHENPRDSALRHEKRLHNQMHPLLPGFEIPAEYLKQETDGLLNIILVHGNKRCEFAYLRAYHHADDLGEYVSLSDNIMKLPSVVASPESEQISKPEVKLRKDKKQTGEGGSSS